MIGDDNMIDINQLENNSTLTVDSLNDLSTGIKTLYEVITELRSKNVRLIVTDCELDSDNEDFELFMKHLQILSEFSSNTLSQRFTNANTEKRQNGTYVSRERTEFSDDFVELYQVYLQKGISKTDMAKKLDISRPTLDKHIRLYNKQIANEKQE